MDVSRVSVCFLTVSMSASFDPVADYDTGNAVPDHIGNGTCFTHETVDAENQRQSGNRNIAERKGSGKDNEARASDRRQLPYLSTGAPQEESVAGRASSECRRLER